MSGARTESASSTLCVRTCNLLRYAGLVNEKSSATERRDAAGLCAECVHARGIESNRKSTFILCELSLNDPRFAKYPRLPVVSCDGFKKKP
jgi:hypothetical protein